MFFKSWNIAVWHLWGTTYSMVEMGSTKVVIAQKVHHAWFWRSHVDFTSRQTQQVQTGLILAVYFHDAESNPWAELTSFPPEPAILRVASANGRVEADLICPRAQHLRIPTKWLHFNATKSSKRPGFLRTWKTSKTLGFSPSKVPPVLISLNANSSASSNVMALRQVIATMAVLPATTLAALCCRMVLRSCKDQGHTSCPSRGGATSPVMPWCSDLITEGLWLKVQRISDLDSSGLEIVLPHLGLQSEWNLLQTCSTSNAPGTRSLQCCSWWHCYANPCPDQRP